MVCFMLMGFIAEVAITNPNVLMVYANKGISQHTAPEYLRSLPDVQGILQAIGLTLNDLQELEWSLGV